MLFTGKDDEIFDMGGVGEEVEGFDFFDLIFVQQNFYITGLSGRVAR